jgi:tRNA-2-methylthio-N6-dimethylallyladenosine synthase
MTDHIVVFEGNERLIGRTIPVLIEEATAFTLFGTAVTGERVGAEAREGAAPPAPRVRRIGLPLV